MILKIRRELDFFISGFAQKESFTRNFSYVLAGKVIIIIFTLLTTPLLTRLYSPEAYGYFAFMNTVASNVSIIAALGFPAALVITDSDREFYNLFVSVFLIIVGFIVVFAAFFLIFIDFILPFELKEEKLPYGYLIIVASFVFSLMQILPKWNIWRNHFKTGAKINVLVSGTSRLTSVFLGLTFAGNSFGLIIGEIVGKALGLGVNIFTNVKNEWHMMLSEISGARMRLAIKKYKRYPHYILTGGYLALLSTHLPMLIFPFAFDAATFGNYSLATGLVAIPGIILAQPISSVFLKKAVSLQRERPEAVPDFLKRVLYGLYLAGVAPFAAVAAFGPEVFAFIFGKEWTYAGHVASVLAFYALIEMLQISVQNILQVYRMEGLIFRYSMVQLILVSVFILPGLYVSDAMIMIWGFTLAKSLSALLLLGRVLDLCRINYKILFLRFALVFAGLLLIFIGLKKSWYLIW